MTKAAIKLDALTRTQLVDVYNQLPVKPVKKFADKTTALKRVEGALKENNAEVEDSHGEPKVVFLKAEKKEKEVKPKAAKAEKSEDKEIKIPGPKGKYADKYLYKKVDTNPRREGTHGHRSFELLKDGMTGQEAQKAGVRSNDLDWDVKHGFVEALKNPRKK